MKYLSSSRQFSPLGIFLPLLLAGLVMLSGGRFLAQAASESPVWTFESEVAAQRGGPERWVAPQRGAVFRLNPVGLQSNLGRVVRAEPSAIRQQGVEVAIPMPDGGTARFRIVETSVMAPELAAKFLEIKTYAGEGVDDPLATLRMDVTPAGFHAQVLSPKGAVYVDPAYRNDAEQHVSYYRRDHLRLADEFRCEVLREVATSEAASGTTEALRTLSGATLRTFRLAVAATGEYTAYHGGTVALGQAAIVTAINRVNGIYEKELAVRLVLVANNNLLVYTNASTDPYDNGNVNAMFTQNQTVVDAIIGSGNYDIGHVFGTGGSGLATLNSVCTGGLKARGASCLSPPTGDPFWVSFVAHEMGHQFGADHTFNGTGGFCAGNRNASTAYERGSGSTIMSYANACGSDDLQGDADPYFHAASIDQVQTFLGGGGGCSVNTGTGNSAPSVSVGGPYTIPANTPFELTATASDPNGDALTYCWEEMDLGPAQVLAGGDNGSSPLFRSLPPTNSPTRSFPSPAIVLVNTNYSIQEVLPTTSRTMNFRVTVRDNRAAGGGVADADTTVTVVNTGSPFRVTSPNTAIVWSNTHTVTWDVAGTTAAPISASGVNIYLSTDGGLTWPHLLVTNTPNDGSHNINVQGLVSTQARIKIQGAGNIFYDVSDVNFTIATIAPNLQTAFTTLISESCTPTNGVMDPYETVVVNWAITNSGNAPTTNLVATLLSTNGIYLPSGSQNYGVIPPGGSATRAFSFIPSAACGGSVTGVVQLRDGPANWGMATRVFNLGAPQPTIVTQVFVNATPIFFDPVFVQADPYPSQVLVSGILSAASKVTVSLIGYNHDYPDDVGVLVANPAGAGVALMTGCGGATRVTNANLTFDSAAANQIPASTAITSGTYRPRDNKASYVLPPPASGRPYLTNLTALGGAPNGTWNLYCGDFISPDEGFISGGWQITIVSTNFVNACCSTLPDPVTPTYTSTTWSNGVVRLNWLAVPGPKYQVQFRTNLVQGGWQNLGGLIPGTNSILGITDNVPGVPTRFYRVLVSP